MPTPEEIAAQNAQGTPPTTPPENVTFDSWMDGQDDTVKGLYTQHTAGLKSALDSERKANQDAQKQLRDSAKKAEKGSELEATLTKQADLLSALEKQTAFQDKAHSAGVRNLHAAFVLAKDADLIDDKGDCDFAALRKFMPELFTATVQGNAGSGTGNLPPKPQTMDQILMGAFGRGTTMEK